MTLNGNSDTLALKGGNTVTVNGPGDSADVAGTGNTLSLYNGQVTLESGAQVSLTGWTDGLRLKGGDTVQVNGGGDTVDVSGTGNTISTMNFSAVTLENGAAAMVTGDGNTITAAANAAIGIAGNANTVTATGTGDTLDLNGTSDTVTLNSGTVTLENGASASINGSNNLIQGVGSTSITASGSGDTFVFQPAFGQDVINGFTSSDSMTFSSSDFANWSALLSDMTQSGSNTVITLDASDKITLTGVTESSLKSSQFHFQ